MWLLFPVGVFIYLAGRQQGKVVVVDKREESDAARVFEEKVEARKQAAIDELDQALVQRTEAVVREHTEAINALTEEQRMVADELLDNPDELRNYLMGVGRRARGASD